MVQIIQENPRRSFGRQLLDNEEKLGSAIDRLVLQKKEKKAETQLGEENTALEKLGVKATGIRNPKIRESLLDNTFKQKQQQEKTVEDFAAEEKQYETVKNAFGQRFADVYKAAPTGGRTELLKTAIDARLRGNDIQKLFDDLPEEVMNKIVPPGQSQVPQATPEGQSKKVEYPKIQPPEGLTPKEKVAYKKDVRSENLPLWKEAKESKRNLKEDAVSIKTLTNINDADVLPQGVEKAAIDQTTGDLKYPGLYNAETQLYFKTLANWTRRAKDFFGSRVTNFDLETFKSSLPTLANTPEGRQLILKQMDLNTKLQSLYPETLLEVYRHYGLDSIAPEQAEEIADSLIVERHGDLINEINALTDMSVDLEDSNSGETVLMYDIDGTPLYVPIEEVDQVKAYLEKKKNAG